MDQETSVPEPGSADAVVPGVDAAGAPGATAETLAATVEADGPLAFADVLALGADVAGQLADAPEDGAGHGAVQPSAIVRRPEGAWLLLAPGLVTDVTAAPAPELAGSDETSAAGDVYALGATLVFALTGQAFVDGALGGDDGDAAGEADATAGAGAETASAADAEAAVPQSLPDVMAAFLDTLRRTLASDPAARVSAAELAGTLRQLRSDVDRLTAPAPAAVTIGPATAGAAMATGVVGATAAGAALGADAGAGVAGATAADAGAVAIDPLTGEAVATPVPDAKTPPSFKQRLPVFVAAAAIIVAVVAVALLLRKDDQGIVAAGPSTSTTLAPTTTVAPVVISVVGTEVTTTTIATTTTTAKKATTTTAPVVAPPPTAPPVTEAPAGTQSVKVDMSHMTNCPGCLASLRTQPKLLSQLTSQFPDKTPLWGQCWTTGDEAHDDQGFTSNQWIYIVGPSAQGWVPIHLVGRQTYGLPACPQATTTAPPTTAAPPTTPAPTTTTTAPSTSTTAKPALVR